MSTVSEVSPAVRLHQVTKVFGDPTAGTVALRAVTADFAAGSFTALMGPSGSGKSTLLMCAAGLTRPSSGVVQVADQRIDNASESALTRLRRDRISFVFQHFQLIDSLTALENVLLPARLAGRRVRSGDALELLDLVGLADRTGHRPAQLSGGQQQRVAIARALITRPTVLFADEPTGALDQSAGAEVLELLRGLCAARGTTVVMVTHDAAAAAAADRVLLLLDGVLVDELRSATVGEISDRVLVGR
ncbi:ABC transporter ATP-binding protein [Salinispora vitiensis]|uniref:ABC transporter ATP-binding protein n=1 Tax=Salinispora vitiensis TaxID=999544 RepID=UPI00037C827B|nr:ABC transporter ATP-binding protein [Salinispora vitiensis]